MLSEFELANRLNIATGAEKITRLFNLNANSIAQRIKQLQTKQALYPTKYGAQIMRNQELLKAINTGFITLESDVNKTLSSKLKDGWILANQKNNDDLMKFNIPKDQIPKAWNIPSDKAYKGFADRNPSGINLSERIHQITEQNKQLYLDYVGTGITQGKGAQEIARELIKVNNDPDNVTVYDKQGLPTKLALQSKLLVPNASGRGIYKSPLKNMLRVARNEVNVSYRTADFDRYQDLDFVIGIEIHLSASHSVRMPAGDQCDSLVGRYPKDFKFTGFHVACLCYQTSILCTKAELKSYFETGKMVSINEVTKMPKDTLDWVAQTGEKAKKFDWVNDKRLITLAKD